MMVPLPAPAFAKPSSTEVMVVAMRGPHFQRGEISLACCWKRPKMSWPE
ncbi:hypothetical protein [Streptomyces sp. NBC_00847]|nr:hypothetical protein [Streptomyces sp. NBC_00847]MCX4885597.1 hypothetical protein [Streptomyces sp. NBC_00847]